MTSDDHEINANLIVNYIPQTLTDEEFKQMFMSIGPIVSSKIIRDRATGYSYGFGFVRYERVEHAEAAVAALNGLQLQNKRVKVAYARKGEGTKGANLYIRNIAKAITAEQVKDAFELYGYVINCRVLADTSTGVSKGVAFVLMERDDQADDAIAAFDGKPFPGTSELMSVKYADDNRTKVRPPPNIPQPVLHQVASSSPQQPPFPAGGYQRGATSYQDIYNNGYSPSYTPPGPMRAVNSGRHRYNPTVGYGGGSSNPPSGLITVAPGSGPNLNAEGFVLFIYNLSLDAEECTLWQLFAPFGAVTKVNVIKDPQKSIGKGYGFVTMTNYHEALNAIQGLNGYRYKDNPSKPLQVSFKS